MIYDVRHVTTYRYDSRVGSAQCTLRLTPRHDNGQNVVTSVVEIDPRPDQVTERPDFFDNHVISARIDATHRQLKIAAQSRVVVERPPIPAPQLTPAWELVGPLAATTNLLGAQSPVHGLFPSRLVPIIDEVTAYAAQSFTPSRPVLEAAADLMRRIRADFRYDPKATEISTPLAEAFAQRGGVCQDFAHIMIAGLRGLGLPSSYVSGYIRTIPPPGRPRLAGADASHAWVRVWCGPEFGWFELDPTNALFLGNDHVTLAIGRDYADVSPVYGVFIGSGRQALSVRVDVKPIE